ncbi:MAG: ABC transporter ATP-binding protein [Bacteriovorax sp.]|nr:ABC transporter ATP-binding protein [Bacteriovorax sp.]
MIEFNNITKKFRNNFWDKEFIAVDNVSFRIEAGDLIGFLGANGAGKTTLIKILMDFSRQTSGNMNFDKIMGQNSNEIKASIGYLPERPYLYPHLTGREFLEYVGNLNSINPENLETRINSWSEKMQIAHALGKLTKEYSKGMLQRLGFVSCLIHNPKLLVLDEPLSGLDPIGRRDFKKIMVELNKSGVTIFFSSHIVSDVEEICNKVIFIEKGKLVYEGNIDTLLMKHANDLYTVKTLNNGKVEVVHLRSEEKNSYLEKMLSQKIEIIEIEKEKITLEEIIYKIKE